ncbi:pneumococcal-type histidine triad protein [Streptococcus suis]|uniref:pneumococcal-type histidine triad protein n=1 Tax=Streptococcus suis TaxID=1307 RepID=UPI0021183FC7|nr:pneumococcal-type histidine triad protein [Streptococcus suis]
MKKKRNLALTGISLLCGLTLLACQQKQATQVLDEKVKQEQVQKEEIVYVVAELTEDGYVLIHGDHQHLEKGFVPYDAKFLKETLLEDKNYQFNEKDILYKVRTGYIIQVKGKVYYYPKKAGAGLVTLEEARKLTANNPEHDHHGHNHNHDHTHEEQNQSSTNQVGVAGIDRPTSDGFLLSDTKQISSKTDTGIIVEHNGHSHFIFYGDLKGSKWEYLIPAGADVTKKQGNSTSSQSSSQDGQDHYQFNPADIVAEDANGYTVRHGDHYHYILKQTVGGSLGNPVHTGASQFASSTAAAPVMQNHLVTLPVSPIANLPVPVVTAGANQAASVVFRQGIAGIDYPTSDGFLFDGSGLIGQNAVGLLIQHQGHIHVLRREQVAASKWAYLLENQASQVSPIRPLPDVVTTLVAKPVEKTEVVAVPSTSSQSQAASPAPVTPAEATVVDEVADKRNYLAQALDLQIGSITLLDTPQGQAFMYPHGDHDHVVLLKNIDLTKPFESEEEEHSTPTPNTSSISETTSSSSEKPTSSSTSTPTTSSQATSESEASTTTSPSLSEVAEAPNSAPVTPAEATVVDEVADKRNYLAQALGLPVGSITLLDTPQGQAFMYPHGDHDHVVLLKNIDLTKPFESEEDLERKIDYISKVYGVPKEAIRVSDTTFSFNDPSHAYDPTHVHPYVILRSMLIIPEVTGDPETDFEAELLAVAKRTGIAPSKLIIRDKKFILPHGSHDHVLHIQAVEGIEPYLTNKLPAISGSYLEGEFDRASVDSQLESLRQVAAEKYGTSSKEYRRIKRALDDFASNLDDLVTNSTKGYLAMLEQFEKVHILKETTNNPEEQVDPLYQSILEQIRLLDISNLPVNKEDLTSQLNQASQGKDRQALLNLEHLLQELKHFQDRPDITAMEYMDYLLGQLDQPYVPADLQERLASTLDHLFQATLGGNGSIKPLDLSKELVDLKVALHLAKAANQTYPIQTSPASEKMQENRAIMEAFVRDIREMFTRQMTFPEIVEKAEHETPVTSPSHVTDNQTYQELLTLLRQTDLTGTQTSQTAWVERINQASLKGDERELASISHSLKEIQHFQDRAEIRLMEYMAYLLTHIDSTYLQAPTRQEAARLINQIYGLVVRRELATSPISLAEDLIASSIAVANDVKGQINQQFEMSDDYGIMQMNRLEMNMFVEGTRDFFVNPLSLPEEVLVKVGQTSPVPAIEEGVGAASPTSQDRPESSSSPIHDHESGSKEESSSSLSQAVEENSSSETGSGSEQATSLAELVEAEAVAPTNSDVLISEESASSDGSKPTEVQEIPSPTEETNASSASASEPSSPAVAEQSLPSESAGEEEVELSDEDLEWLSDIFGEFTGSTSEEESEDIGLTWKPIGNIEGWS